MAGKLESRGARIGLAVIAFVATILVAGYQRRTGPSWPIGVRTEIDGAPIRGELPRSHPGPGDQTVSLEAPPEVSGELTWRRYPTTEAWTRVPMRRAGEALTAELPHQPPSGKLEYSVRLRGGERQLTLPAGEAAVIRFRGDVPAWVLVPHILAMFVALFASVRAGLGAAVGEPRPSRFIRWILIFLIPGGLVLGPVVQKLSFGAFWTGWPFGGDWTDNKTIIVALIWALAAWYARRNPSRERAAVLLATVIMFGVYLIPHSIHGSQLDWNTVGSDGPTR